MEFKIERSDNYALENALRTGDLVLASRLISQYPEFKNDSYDHILSIALQREDFRTADFILNNLIVSMLNLSDLENPKVLDWANKNIPNV